MSTVRGETSCEGAKRPGGEISKGRNVLLPIVHITKAVQLATLHVLHIWPNMQHLAKCCIFGKID